MQGTPLRRIVAGIVGLVAALACPAVFAIKNQPCPNCTTDQMLTVARASGLGTIYVWNPHTGDVHKYQNYCGSPQRAGTDDKGAVRVDNTPSPYGACGNKPMATDELTVEPQYAEVAPHLGKIWVATNGSWVIGDNVNALKSGTSRGLRVPLPIGFGGYYPQNPTAHDFMTDYNLRGQIRDYVDTQGMTGAPSWVQTAVAYVKANINATMAYTQGITMNFEVVFPDGSSIVYNQSLSALPNYVAESGRDTAGYTIPEGNAPQYAGNWNYDPSTGAYARGRLIDLLDRLNANINYMDANGYRIRCTWDGQTLHCTVRR